MFNPKRLELAMKRRQLTSRILSEQSGVSPVTLSRIINQKQAAEPETIESLVNVLNFPRKFFFLDDPDSLNQNDVSFRSLSSMRAKERDAALSAGSIAFELIDYMKERFDLPSLEFIQTWTNMERSPSSMARIMRNEWGLGEKPIGNIISLFEAKGIRVFSLSERTKNVDAFSAWRGDEPYVFLNNFKSAEHSRFDAAHELGHLVMHRHGGPSGREAEQEANQFASAFLMPEADIKAHIPYVTSSKQLIKAKKRWGVSVVALAYRLNKMGLLTEWHYIQVNRSYRSKEPEPMQHEYSKIWQMVFTELWKDGISKKKVAMDLCIPDEELESLVFGLSKTIEPPNNGKTELKMIKNA